MKIKYLRIFIIDHHNLLICISSLTFLPLKLTNIVLSKIWWDKYLYSRYQCNMCIVYSIHKMPQLKTKMIKNISQYIKSTFKYFFLKQLCYFSYCSFTNLQRIGVNLAYIKINNLFFIPNVKLLNAVKFNLNETLLTFMLYILFHFFRGATSWISVSCVCHIIFLKLLQTRVFYVCFHQNY